MASRTKNSRVYQKAEGLFGIDLRSLALFRICLGLVLLWDLGVRATALRAHYTDAGILPRSVLFEAYPRELYLSLHALSGAEFLQIFLFIIAGLVAGALVIGYRTRIAAILSWGLLLSLHVRNPAVLNSGDVILLLLLFWGMLLPLGVRFSIDAKRKVDESAVPQRIVSAASLGILLQVCFIYWFSVVWKSAPEWHAEGTAVYYALSLDRFATFFGQWLLTMPDEFLRILTRSTIWLEVIGPVLAFVPVFTGPIRTAVVGAFILFHLGLGLAMTLGIFPVVCMVAWLVFLPSWFWDVALPWLRHLFNDTSRKAVRQSVPAMPAMQSSLAMNVVAILAIWYIGFYNFYTLDHTSSAVDKYFYHATPVGQTINLNQTWKMFSPRPSTSDGWYVVVGTLSNGEQVDVFQRGAPVSWERPHLISPTYRNQRWRKYKGERLLKKQETLGPHFANYLWHEWHSKNGGDRELESLEIYQMYERVLANHERTPAEKRLISRLDSEQLSASADLNTDTITE